MGLLYTHLKRKQVILHVDTLTFSSSVLTGGIMIPMSSQLKVHSHVTQQFGEPSPGGLCVPVIIYPYKNLSNSHSPRIHAWQCSSRTDQAKLYMMKAHLQ